MSSVLERNRQPKNSNKQPDGKNNRLKANSKHSLQRKHQAKREYQRFFGLVSAAAA